LNWRQNLGPALTDTGHAILAGGMVTGLEVHRHLVTAVAAVGFILWAAGRFFTRLFNAPPPAK
jgi:hypothetical protein